MLPGNVRLRSRPTRMGNAVLGSWIRTAAVAAALIAVFAVLATLVLTGRLGDLRYTNIPLVHPYPPAGYYQNPFNPGDRSDLVNSVEAAKVKSDLLRDGNLQLDALARGDPSGLSESASGAFLANLQALVAANNAKGVLAPAQNPLESLTIGRLPDPNNPSVTWCVLEKGTGTTTLVDKRTGTAISRQSFKSQSKFWLVRQGDRYLIVDAEINSQAGGSG
jgi:hypothetical protein